MKHSYTLLGWGRDYNPVNWFYNPAYAVNRIYLILGGTVIYKDYLKLQPGKVYLFRTDTEFRVVQSKEDPVDHIFFDFLTDSPLIGTEYLEIEPNKNEGLMHLVQALRAEKFDPLLPQEIEIGRYYLGLLLHALEDRLLRGVEYSPVTEETLKILHGSNLAELSIAKIASKLCLDENYVIRCFKREMGVTPHRYLAMMKKDQAISFLRKGMSCTEIAQLLGFGSLSAFSYFFKKETGSSVASFKRMNNMG